jgi:hypothetical protein
MMNKGNFDMPGCWECKYLIDNQGVNFVQDFKCDWFRVFKNAGPKLLLPNKNPDEGCKYFEPREAEVASE